MRKYKKNLRKTNKIMFSLFFLDFLCFDPWASRPGTWSRSPASSSPLPGMWIATREVYLPGRVPPKGINPMNQLRLKLTTKTYFKHISKLKILNNIINMFFSYYLSFIFTLENLPKHHTILAVSATSLQVFGDPP